MTPQHTKTNRLLSNLLDFQVRLFEFELTNDTFPKYTGTNVCYALFNQFTHRIESDYLLDFGTILWLG